VINRSDRELLEACTEFRKIDDHVAMLQASDPERMMGRIARMAELGLLVSYQELLDPEHGEAAAGEQITWIAIPTCGSAGRLVPAFGSYLHQSSRHGWRPSFLIADDSPGEAAWRLCRSQLRGMAERAGVRLVYSGRAERRRLVRALNKSGELPPEVIRFALLGDGFGGETIGANRNGILLQLLGSKLLCADDDTVCRPAVVANSLKPGVCLGNHESVNQFWFFENRKSALRHVCPKDLDVIAEHERLLGHGLPEVTGLACEGPVDMKGTCGHLLQSLASGRGSVGVTLNGIAGDSGMHANTWLLLYGEHETRKRLAMSETYHMAAESRNVVRQVMTPTIAHAGPLMSTVIGLDNRQLLPPFFPVYRNEDGVFGECLARCFPDCYVGHLPWTLVHNPPERKAYAADAASSVRISDIVLACLGAWGGAPTGVSPARALALSGQYLIELGGLPPREFDEAVRLLLYRRASNALAQMEKQLRHVRTEGVEHIASGLAESMKQIAEAVMKPSYLQPIDLVPAFSDDALRVGQSLVLEFGRLMVWWPSIVERTRALLSREWQPWRGVV
jgi:hypothetical protein